MGPGEQSVLFSQIDAVKLCILVCTLMCMPPWNEFPTGLHHGLRAACESFQYTTNKTICFLFLRQHFSFSHSGVALSLSSPPYYKADAYHPLADSFCLFLHFGLLIYKCATLRRKGCLKRLGEFFKMCWTCVPRALPSNGHAEHQSNASPIPRRQGPALSLPKNNNSFTLFWLRS